MNFTVLKEKVKQLLQRAEPHTKTDMVYLSSNTFWITVGQFISNLFALGSAAVFAHFMSKDMYASYKYILAVTNILSLCTLPGMTTAVTQAVARGYDGAVFGTLKMKIRWGILGGLMAGAIAVYYFIHDNTLLGGGFLMSGIFLPFMDTSILFSSILNGKKLFKISSLYSTCIQSLSLLALMTTVYVARDNVMLAIFVLFASETMLRLLFFVITIRRHITDRKIDPETSVYGKKLSWIASIGTVAGQIDSLLMWHFLGPIALANYSFAMAPLTPFRTLFKSLVNIALPKFSVRDTNEIQRTLPRRIFRAMALLIIPTVILILLLPILFDWLFPQYSNTVIYAQVATLSLLFFPEKLIGIALTAHGRTKELSTIAWVGSISKILLVLILLPLFGIWGSVFSLLISHVILFCVSFYLFKRMK